MVFDHLNIFLKFQVLSIHLCAFNNLITEDLDGKKVK